MTRLNPLSFYWSLVRRVPGLFLDAWNIYSAIAGFLTVLLVFNQPLAQKLLQAQGISPWFGLVPLSGLFLFLVLRANYDVYSTLNDRWAEADRGLAAQIQPSLTLRTPPARWGKPMDFGTQFLEIQGDCEAIARGGSKGGAITGLEWSVRNLPAGFSSKIETPSGPIVLQANEIKALMPCVKFSAKMTPNDALKALEESKENLELVVTYSTESGTGQSVLPLPTRILIREVKTRTRRGEANVPISS